MFGEWYQKTIKTEDTNKLTLLGFKIIAILQGCVTEMVGGKEVRTVCLSVRLSVTTKFL
jgi:hypothetical protein